jgi:hypothetical protein
MRSLAYLTVSLLFVTTLAIAQQQVQPSPQTPAAPQALKIPASPRGLAATQVGGKWVEAAKPGDAPRYTEGKWITVDYGRPILRGRPNIFGSGAEYGKKVNDDGPVWRAGANQTTRLRTEVPLIIGGKTVPAGEYSVFVDLKPTVWTLILSTQPAQQKYDPNNKTETWGSYNYDPKFDVLRAPMTLSKGPSSIDQFTIQFVDITATGGTLTMAWDTDIATAAFKIGQ